MKSNNTARHGESVNGSYTVRNNRKEVNVPIDVRFVCLLYIYSAPLDYWCMEKHQ